MTSKKNHDGRASRLPGSDRAAEDRSPPLGSPEFVMQYRASLASELQSIAGSLGGGSRRRLRRLADQVADASDWQAVLRRPAVLELYHAIDQRLVQTDVGSGSGGRARKEQCLALRQIAAGVLAQHEGSFKKLDGVMSRLIYPLVLLVLFVIMLVLTCYWVVPELRMVVERQFGLVSPQTEWLFATADIVRAIGWPHLLGLLAVVSVLGLWRKQVASKRSGVLPWSATDAVWGSPRAALGNWAWHLATLIEAGLSTGEAMAVVAESSHPSWLRRQSRRWLRKAKVARDDNPSWWPRRLRNRRIDLLSYALFVDQPSADDGAPDASLPAVQTRRSDLLRQVAVTYWERQASLSRFWTVLATPIAYLVVGFWLGWIWFAIFSPLVSFITLLS